MLSDVLLDVCIAAFALVAISASVAYGVQGFRERTRRALVRNSRHRSKSSKGNPPIPFDVPIEGANRYRYLSTSATDRLFRVLRERRIEKQK